MLTVTNPFNQETVAELPWDTALELEEKISRAEQAHKSWREVPLRRRVRAVAGALAYFRKERENLAREITLQMGKPILQARREVDTMLDRAETMVRLAPRALAPENLPQKRGFHRRIEQEALGVVLNMAAWNYPLLIPVNVIVPALIAGNSVLLKHSARTPLTGNSFVAAFGGIGPGNLVASLIISHEQTEKLIADKRIQYVAFTGSVEGGRQIYQRAAGRLVNVGLELGGKDPAYVAADARLDFAVENIVDGVCYNAGQSCCAVERVYVHKKLYPEFLERARALMARYQLGDPLSPETTLGPLASRGALSEIEAKVKQAVERGARVIAGGKRSPDVKGNFFPPTLVADVPNDASLMQEETFGPVMPVAGVESDEEALARMADTRFGLTASVWTRSRSRAERFARELAVGTVYQNRCDYLDPLLPWTGVGESGFGSTLSRYGFLHLTRRKSIHFRA